MRYFPLFHDTKGLSVVVIGGGEVAARKLTLWSRTEARLTVIAPRVVPAVDGLIKQGRVRHLAQFYHDEQLKGHQGVITATDDPALNRTVSEHARARGLWVNVVDDPQSCTVITPALVDRSPVVVAIGSEGGAPVLVRSLRARLEGLLPSSLGALARFIGEQRPRIMEQHREPRLVWQRFLQGNGLAWRADTPDRLAQAEREEDAQGRLWLVLSEQQADTLPIAALTHLQQLDAIYHLGSVPEALEALCRRDAERHALDSEALAEIAAGLKEGAQVLVVLPEAAQDQWQSSLAPFKPTTFVSGAVCP
ncbi:bifunctional precorrin-2 dehydrogenase/sirohydrochlorin ferrochelatase [Ferrimonas balearica]|uniref:precorrin-2 dehydrogenase/sirohydrochlorin ferrochelatase family protein n=1 Tax=Ferrimonas balearica TaxID=44012 RepID=UPI001C9A2815|nr:bifunctional precorrin-2 dehydrogenase/sirohydrochlorin ferrochelatase [Ferrimonas balearica]MBY5992802.1 bifunctional precorrin-2 dehydrogenase/sirohydrochlorin ferrochelatase [Ferrimonas balearica]